MTTLNPQQMQAVQHDTGALLVLAGAGSGKTRIVTQRILSLIESGVLPQQIVAITFTNKAAKEMQERVKDMGYSSVLVRTFHSLGAYILRESIHHLGYDAAFTIYDEDDKQKLISQIAKKLKVDLKQCSTKQASQCISSLKNSFHEESHLKQLPLEERSLVDEWVSLIWPQYQQTLRDNNAVDFDDLIVLPVKLFNSFSSVKDIYVERWPYLLIDEYQDTNPTQCFLARLLAGNYHNILAVGDPDQSIYSWRGADIQNIMNFEQDFPEAKVVYLEQNYRSTETILQASNALIQNNTTRYDKKLWTQGEAGAKINVHQSRDEYDEAHWIVERIKHSLAKGVAPREIGVLYRMNALSKNMEDALLVEGVPYVIYGGLSFYERKEVKDFVALLMLMVNPLDALAFQRLMMNPKKGCGFKTLYRIIEMSREQDLTLIAYLSQLLQAEYCPIRLTKAQKIALQHFVELWADLQTTYTETPSIALLLKEYALKSGYIESLKEDPLKQEERLEHIEQLIKTAENWEKGRDGVWIKDFLEELSLRIQAPEQEVEESIQLMTLHNSKGLEFEEVFLMGMEETIFPHVRNLKETKELEEERRLCYVGMTRTKKKLYLTCCKRRFLWGYESRMEPSRFLEEIPRKYVSKDLFKERGSSNFVGHRCLYTKEPSLPSGEFGVGQWIKHSTFGVGKIVKTSQGGYGVMYDIIFDNTPGVKTLVGKYAKLQTVK